MFMHLLTIHIFCNSIVCALPRQQPNWIDSYVSNLANNFIVDLARENELVASVMRLRGGVRLISLVRISLLSNQAFQESPYGHENSTP